MDGASVGTVPHCSRLRPLEPPPALQKCRDFAWNESCFAARDMSRRLLVGTLLATAATLGLVFAVGRRTPVYSMGVAEFVERGLADERVRVRVRRTLFTARSAKWKTGCGHDFEVSQILATSSGKYEFNRNELLARLALPVPDCKAQPARL